MRDYASTALERARRGKKTLWVIEVKYHTFKHALARNQRCVRTRASTAGRGGGSRGQGDRFLGSRDDPFRRDPRPPRRRGGRQAPEDHASQGPGPVRHRRPQSPPPPRAGSRRSSCSPTNGTPRTARRCEMRSRPGAAASSSATRRRRRRRSDLLRLRRRGRRAGARKQGPRHPPRPLPWPRVSP